MSVTQAALSITASVKTEEVVAAGLPNRVFGPFSLQPSCTLDRTVLNAPVVLEFNLADAATQSIDLFALTDQLAASKVMSKIRGIVLAVKTPRGKAQVRPGTSNDILATYFLRGTAPELHLEAGAGTGLSAFALWFGVNVTVDATHRNLRVTNSSGGGLACTYQLILFGGV